MAKSPYETLGVSKNATQDEIKKAYRKLVREVHPDRNPGNEERFKEVQGAYDVLSDPEKRNQYDRLGTTNGRPFGFGGSGGGTTYDFTDFDLGDIFGGLFNRGGRAQQQQQRGQRGNDVEVEVRVAFEDALKGVQVTIPVELELACHTCHGTGAAPGTAPVTCPECSGSGVVATSQGLFALQQPCPRCHGRGSIVQTPCETCHGSGRERRTKRYTVKIPAGVKDGTRIKLKGKGEAGYGGAEAGDLYVISRVEPSKIYERRGDDLIVAVAGAVHDRRARREGRGADARGRSAADGARRHRGREAAAHQGPWRAAPQRLGSGRRARADQDPGAQEGEQEAARASRAAAEGGRVTDVGSTEAART